MRSVPALALAALLASQAALGAPPRFVDYLYIEANEGGSSGGHTAIRFADEVYHFQHERPGVLRLRRDNWPQFRWVYGVLENRTMHVSRIATTESTWTRLRERFSDRHLSERRVFAQRDVLADDRTLLSLLAARREGDASGSLRVRGAGFFFPEEDSALSAAMLALRDRILAAHGPDVIRQRTDAIRAELARLVPAPDDDAAPDVTADMYPTFPRAFSTRYRDLLTALIALRVVDHALPLRGDASWEPRGHLDPAERDVLAEYADRLTGELTRLLRSERPDWGFALLVGMARLEALRASVATGRLVLLDAFPPDAEVLAPRRVRQERDALSALRAEAADELERARALLRPGAGEAEFAAVETAGNRLFEVDVALAQDRGLRVASGALLPSRDAAWSELIVPDLARADMQRSVTRAGAAEDAFARRLVEQYGYHLITHNCVSEIFRTVNDAGAEPQWHVDPAWSLDFIPFVSSHTVNGRWNVVEETTLPSYRRVRLDAMAADQSALRVRLRESNVVTSILYRRNAADSFFLLFTDDVPALRPIFGAVNLAAGLGATAAGVALLPFDRGHTLWSGVRGAVFSLPELAFISLRKGSFAIGSRGNAATPRSATIRFDVAQSRNGPRAVSPHQVSTHGRFFPVRGGDGGTARSALVIRRRDSAGSITSSISK